MKHSIGLHHESLPDVEKSTAANNAYNIGQQCHFYKPVSGLKSQSRSVATTLCPCNSDLKDHGNMQLRLQDKLKTFVVLSCPSFSAFQSLHSF